MRFDSLEGWLRWQESLHPSEIELGLERVGEVARRLGLLSPSHAVITVAGTNGKGSSVAMLEAILLAGGYRTGSYTSPHLLRYNERVRLDGKAVADASLCAAFEAIDQARGEISLSYFEFGTLAALYCFEQAGLDVAVLEVGLGGRLDAVNIIDADVALVTAIDLDHSDWLGDSREQVALEKAGIFRSARPAVVSDPSPPQSLLDYAASIGAPLSRLQHEYGADELEEGWRWWGPEGSRIEPLPMPALRGRFQLDNAAGVLMALQALEKRLPLSRQALREGLHAASLPGRFQRILHDNGVEEFIDVAHNPQAARELAVNLRALPAVHRSHAVVAMLADKDIEGVLAPLMGCFDHWSLAPLAVPRGADAQQIAAVLGQLGVSAPSLHADVAAARAAALAELGEGDRLVTFGSFYTVAEALV